MIGTLTQMEHLCKCSTLECFRFPLLRRHQSVYNGENGQLHGGYPVTHSQLTFHYVLSIVFHIHPVQQCEMPYFHSYQLSYLVVLNVCHVFVVCACI